MQVNVYTVSQINGYIKRLLERDVFISDVYIEGEISNFKAHSSGHLYFSLKDRSGSIDCVMFQSYANGLAFMPQNGESVLVRGRVSLFEKMGRYQLYVSYMQPAGQGALALEFERLKKKLSAEGLFDTEHKKPIPEFPKTVALVTSPTGAAVRDMINVAKRRNPSVKLVIVPVLVQGENAAEDIAKGIELVNKWGGAEVMIVGRGGGSMEDLWAFNEETVARAVYASKIPIISAVGHEVDFTIADFTADLRAATPSAAAELAIPAAESMDRRLRSSFRQIERAVSVKLKSDRQRLEHAVSVRGLRRPMDNIYNYGIFIENLLEGAEKSVLARLELGQARLEKGMNSAENLSPINVLKRGYSLAYDKNDTLIKSVEQVETDDEIKLDLKDGVIIAEVKSKQKTEEIS